MHHGSDCYRKLAPASVALNQSVPDFVGFRLDSRNIITAAMRTLNSFGPTDVFKDCPGLVFRQTANIYGRHIV
jgi:hypothetical protein